MRETVIHVGLPKTGSTFLQRNIFGKLPDFKLVTPPYTQHQEDWNRMQYADGSFFDDDGFRKEAQRLLRTANKLLISDEHFVGKAIYGGMHRSLICERLKKQFPDAKILIVIRGQFDITRSLHNQWVKGARKGTKTIGSFFWHRKTEYDPTAAFSLDDMVYNTNEDYIHFDFLDYLNLIRLYKNSFDEVMVLPYELLASEVQEFVRRLIDFLDLEYSDFEFESHQVNRSLSTSELAKLIFNNAVSNIPMNRIDRAFMRMKYVRSIEKRQKKELTELRGKMQSLYREMNEKIVSDYPEIGIQDFPEAYGLIGTD